MEDKRILRNLAPIVAGANKPTASTQAQDEALESLLTSKNSNARLSGAKACMFLLPEDRVARLEDRVARLANLLHDEDADVRYVVAEVLQDALQHGAKSARLALEAMASDSDREVREFVNGVLNSDTDSDFGSE